MTFDASANSDAPIKSIGIVGMGHIGTSIALGLQARGAVEKIHGYDIDPESLKQATSRLDDAQTHKHLLPLAENVQLIVLATPPVSIAPLCKKLQSVISDKQIVTDVASIKKPILNEIEEQCGEIPPWFIPGHPIAGTEKSGPKHADGNIFRNCQVILTPSAAILAQSESADTRELLKLGTITWMWQQLGAHVTPMDAGEHDTLFASISHLPHVVAYALMELLGSKFRHSFLKRYAGGGLRDTTRIASSDPDLWVDICLANREHLLPILRQYQDRLDNLARALDEKDSDSLWRSFSAAKQARDAIHQKSDD